MSAYPPPTSNSGQMLNINAPFNKLDYLSQSPTQPVADSRYLLQTGGSISGPLTVTELISAHNGLAISGQNGLTVEANVAFGHTLTVSGYVTANDGLTVEKGIIANNGLTVNGTFTANNGLEVTGELHAKTLVVEGLITAKTGLDVTGELHAKKTLVVEGLITAKTGLDVTGELHAINGLIVDGHITAKFGLNVTGSSFFAHNGLAAAGDIYLKTNPNLSTFDSNGSTIPTPDQLGYQIVGTPPSSSSTQIANTQMSSTGISVDAQIDIPYGTYMVYGQMNVFNIGTTGTIGIIGLLQMSISSDLAVLDSTKITVSNNIPITGGSGITQNTTAIVSNYTGNSITYYLLNRLVPLSGGGSYTTNDSAVLTAVRIA